MGTERTNTTMSADIKVKAREVDFVSRFNNNWDDLREILGITRPIRKAPGSTLVVKTAYVDGGLATPPGEGEPTNLTKLEVKEKNIGKIDIERYEAAVTVNAIANHGAELAVEKTDDAFLVELQNDVMGRFYTFLGTGTLTGTQKTWQRALAIAKGAALNKFKKMHKTVTEVVGFANIMDYYNWLGDQQITIQTLNGIQYIKDFMGYSTLFLMSDDEIEANTVIATPVENIILYYIDPGDSDFTKAGLDYTVKGETNLIGLHIEPDYKYGTSNSFALMGMELMAEFLDGICVITVDDKSENKNPTSPDPTDEEEEES